MNQQILKQYQEGINLASDIAEQRKLNNYPFLVCASASRDARKELTSDECHVVYFFYGISDELLYVGRTNNFKKRWNQHLQSEKDMPQIHRVCLHLFDTKPETIFYEAQKIAGLQPKWNISGMDGKVARNTIKPWYEVWFDCRMKPSEEETDNILLKMEMYYTQDWFDRMSDNDLEQEFYRIHRLHQWKDVPKPYERNTISVSVPTNVEKDVILHVVKTSPQTTKDA